MNKQKRGQERGYDNPLLPILVYMFVSQRHIAFQAFSLY